ncbi:hypothetical protein FRC07_014922, partial [Ceratobasidium sp. 392]
DVEGEGNSWHQTPPRSRSTSELATDGLGELLESRNVVIGISGSTLSWLASTREVRASSRMVFMKEFIVE